MARDRLCAFKRATIEQILCDAGGPERVAVGRVSELGRLDAPLDHPEDVHPARPALAELSCPRQRAPQRRTSLGRDPGGLESDLLDTMAAVPVGGEGPCRPFPPVAVGSSARRARKHVAATAVDALAGARPWVVKFGQPPTAGCRESDLPAPLFASVNYGRNIHTRDSNSESHDCRVGAGRGQE